MVNLFITKSPTCPHVLAFLNLKAEVIGELSVSHTSGLGRIRAPSRATPLGMSISNIGYPKMVISLALAKATDGSLPPGLIRNKILGGGVLYGSSYPTRKYSLVI